MSNLILYDDSCSFCKRAVSHLKKIDKKKRLSFAPLNGKKAREILGKNLQKYQKMNTLVLIENYGKRPKIFVRAKAILRIYVLLGGWRKIFGIFPTFLGDPLYRFIAKHRHRLF